MVHILARILRPLLTFLSALRFGRRGDTGRAAATSAGPAATVLDPDAPDGSGEKLPPPCPEPLPRIEGYEILREVGRGGQAVVYEALQLRLDRRVALKVIQGGHLIHPEELLRVRRE